MTPKTYCLVTDRGGHLHNALKLVEQLGSVPDAIITTLGPDVDALQVKGSVVFRLPHLFKWFGKLRLLNPWNIFLHLWESGWLVVKLRPRRVVSLGASNVVFFCYWAWIWGADIYHVECMNQVKTPSLTGRLLYPITKELFVQWEELLQVYGSKARYEGWVL